MKHRLTLSIRGGLVLLVILAVLPALALQVYDGAVQRRSLVADATQEARRAAESMAQVQARLTDSTRLLLSTLALTPQVRHMDIAVCTDLFASLLAQNPVYHNLLAVDAQGEVVVSGRPHSRLDPGLREHLLGAMTATDFTAGEFLVEHMGTDPAFPFAYPIRDDAGAITGQLLAGIKLSAYDTMFDTLSLPKGSRLTILDARGLRLHIYPESQVRPMGKGILPEIWRVVAGGGDSGVARMTDIEGQQRFFSFAKARLASSAPPYLTFLVSLPETAVLGPARQALIQNIALLAGTGGLALWIAWFVGGAAVGRRLDRIADMADRIGRGDLTARTGLPHGGSGIGKVARTLDAMAELLDVSDAAKERALAALRQSQERMAHITASMADWIWEIDEHDRFCHTSERVRHLGYDPDDLRGHTPYEFMEPSEAARTRAVFEAVKARGEPLRDLEYWFVAKDGRHRCQHASGVPWHDETGTYRGYRGVSTDVTERVQAERDIRDSLRDKEILLKEIHHRVKNNLQIISGLLYLQEEQVEDAKALEAFRVSRNRIASMALVHEKLYRSSNLSRVCLGEYVRDLLPRLFGDAGGQPCVDCRLDLGDVRVPIEQAVPSGLIINELLTNAYKHGFAGREAGRLDISVAETDGSIEIEIRDDGPGLPEGLDISRTASLGMQLVNNLARQLRGSFSARNDGGTVATLRFPRQAP